MPYATDNQIGQKEITGGIEITDQEYSDAMAAQIAGDVVAVRDGKLKILSQVKRTVYSTTDGSALKIPENDDTPDGYTDMERPSEFHNWDGTQWVEDTAAKLQHDRETASLPRMDFMMALKQAGIYLQAADYAASLARDHDWRIRWETAQTFHRTNPDLIAGAKELGLTDADLDALFGIS